MTVAELIAKLQSVPQDSVVLYRAYSDYQALQDDDLITYSKDDQDGIVCHHGHWMRCKEAWKDGAAAAEVALVKTVNAVVFPGN